MFEIEIGNFPIFLAGANKNTSDLYTKMNKMMRKKWTEFLPWKMFADWEDYSIFGGLLRQARAERETESVFECVCCLPVWAKLPANVAGEPQKSWVFWEIWGKPTGQAGQRERQREKVCLCVLCRLSVLWKMEGKVWVQLTTGIWNEIADPLLSLTKI